MTDTPTSCLRIAHARFAPVGVDQHIGVDRDHRVPGSP